VKTLDTRRN